LLLNSGHDIGLPLPVHELKSLAAVWELAAGGALREWHQQEAALLDNVNAKQMAGADID
jgi:CRISPR/Cas system endoribonuclease Cas6 (RAMP superfamily)